MYGLIWRILPGPWISKLIMAVGLLAGGCALLWLFAFPAISPHMPFNDGAVEIGDNGEPEADEAPEGEGDEAPEAEEVPEDEEPEGDS